MNNKTITNHLNIACKAALKRIKDLLIDNGLDYVDLNFNLFHKAYNVNLQTGESYALIRIAYYPDDGCAEYSGLVALSSGGTLFSLGEDIDGQDNYEIVGLTFLVDAVEEAVNSVLSATITCQSTTKDAIRKSIKEFVGPNGNLPFEFGFPYPNYIPNGNDPFVITGVTDRGVTIQNTKEKIVPLVVPYESLSKRALLHIVDSVNLYIKFIHNTVNV